MAKRNRTRGPAQSSSSPKELGSEALANARKRLAQAEAERAARAKLSTKEKRQFDRRIQAAKSAELRAELQQVRAFGFYTPRLQPGESVAALTRSRKAAVRRAFRQLEAVQKGHVFASYPRTTKQTKKQIAQQVKAQGGRPTRKGVFLPREEGELRKGSTRIVRDKATGLWQAEQVYRYTDRMGVRREIKVERYLDGADALMRQEESLKKRFDRMAADLPKDQAIRFTIGGPNGNVSRRAFRNWRQFIAYVNGYRRDPAAQASFMASLTIYTAGKESLRSHEYRVPVAWADRAGRRHEAAPEMLYEGGRFPKPAQKGRGRRKRAKK